MDLFNKMKNIRGLNNEDELVRAISNVKNKLAGLTEERMCKVYSSYLLNELNNCHIPARLVNTLDLGLNYEHYFVLVSKNESERYFLTDLTFSQFKNNSDLFKSLLDTGYQSIDNDILNCYLRIVSQNNYDNYILLDNIFYDVSSVNKKM